MIARSQPLEDPGIVGPIGVLGVCGSIVAAGQSTWPSQTRPTSPAGPPSVSGHPAGFGQTQTSTGSVTGHHSLEGGSSSASLLHSTLNVLSTHSSAVPSQTPSLSLAVTSSLSEHVCAEGPQLASPSAQSAVPSTCASSSEASTLTEIVPGEHENVHCAFPSSAVSSHCGSLISAVAEGASEIPPSLPYPSTSRSSSVRFSSFALQMASRVRRPYDRPPTTKVRSSCYKFPETQAFVPKPGLTAPDWRPPRSRWRRDGRFGPARARGRARFGLGAVVRSGRGCRRRGGCGRARCRGRSRARVAG